MSTPLVSVGIPTYNRPEGLLETLQNIAKQSYKNLEIIVSDNCSPEANGIKVKQILENFYRNDNRVKYYIQEQNMGAHKNFAFVLSQATGEYFMWAADDDIIEPEFINECVQNHISGDYGVVFSKWNVSIKNKKSILNKLIRNPDHSYVADDDWRIRIEKYLSIAACTHKSNILYGLWQRKFIVNIYGKFTHFPDENVFRGMDITMIAHALVKKRAFCINKVLFNKYYPVFVPGSYKCCLQFIRTRIIRKKYLKKCIEKRRIYLKLKDSYNTQFNMLEYALKEAGLTNDETGYLLQLHKKSIKYCAYFE